MNPTDAQIQQEIREVDKYYQLGLTSFHQKKYNEAIDLFTKSLETCVYIQALDSYMARALCFMITERYQEAIDDFTDPLLPPFNKNSDNLDADINRFTNVGFAYYKLGKYVEAIDFYEKVLILDPSDKDAKLMLPKLKFLV